jgi:hypothetical protein
MGKAVLEVTEPVRSKRGAQMRGSTGGAVSVLEQISPRPGGPVGGPAAYYVRKDGATIREALVVQPNGAPIKGDDGEYEQRRALKDGMVYIGPALTIEGIQLLIQTLAENRDDYILFLKEEIEATDLDAKTSDEPKTRAYQRARCERFRALLKQAEMPLDGEALYSELQSISQAQELASLPKNVREVMLRTVGQVNGRVQEIASQLGIKETALDQGGAVKFGFVDNE